MVYFLNVPPLNPTNDQAYLNGPAAGLFPAANDPFSAVVRVHRIVNRVLSRRHSVEHGMGDGVPVRSCFSGRLSGLSSLFLPSIPAEVVHYNQRNETCRSLPVVVPLQGVFTIDGQQATIALVYKGIHGKQLAILG